MVRAVQVFLVGCLLQGCSCQNWAVFLPQSVEGLAGSCARIPCTFSIEPEYKGSLDGSCAALWRRGSTVVFDSSGSPSLNIMQGNLVGNLRDQNCTTIFNNLPPNHNETYSFRLQCDNRLKFSFPTLTWLNTKHNPPVPAITPSSQAAYEGTSLTLNCTAESYCPALPPALTWTPRMGDVLGNQEAASVTSLMTFTTSYLQNGQSLACTALYRRQAGNSDLSFQSRFTLTVLYAPKNTSASYTSPVRVGSSMTLACNTNANPAAGDYTWYKVDGDQVTDVGSATRTLTAVAEVGIQFCCQAGNQYGSQNSSVTRIDVQYPPRDTTVVVTPLVIIAGGPVTLRCSSQANPPAVNYTWRAGNAEEEEGEQPGGTLFIASVGLKDGGNYSCEARNEVGEGTTATVQLDIQYPPQNTSLSADPPGPVPDGSSVTLTCTSAANPAAVFTWYRVTATGKATLGSQPRVTFNVTKLSDDEYYCEAANVHGSQNSEDAKINVTFAPEILPSSSCVKVSSKTRCSCDSRGNPPPTLVWELDGHPVNNCAYIPIKEVPLGSAGTRSVIDLPILEKDASSLVCHSSNSLGSCHLAFSTLSSGTGPGLSSTALLIGAAIGAVGVLFLCVPLLLLLCRRGKGSIFPTERRVDNSDLLVINEANSSDAVYENKATIEREEELNEDQLHYATVDFVKLRAHVGGKDMNGEIRGLSSMTEEYAEIHPRARGGDGAGGGGGGGEAGGKNTPADALTEQK